MRRLAVLVLVGALCGCDRTDYGAQANAPQTIGEPAGKSVAAGKARPGAMVNAAEAIGLVQKSESIYQGVTTTKAIAGLLSVMQARGRFVDLVGWSQEYRAGGTHDVWLEVRINDEPSKFHWIITPEGIINPANALAQNVTKRQQAKL